MDHKQFVNSSAGRVMYSPRNYWAFVPHHFPPKLSIDWKLANLLSEADRTVSALSGVGRLLPNPHLLISPYIRREAVLSSRIENTHAGLDDLLFFEADESDSPTLPDVKEVANYVRAIDHGLKRLSVFPISTPLIREIHAILMDGVRGGNLTPGEFRRSQNWIGPGGCTINTATYVPPPVDEMNDCLSAWEKYIHADVEEPTLIQCALLHYQFEAIHPFIDGNGRVGRLLIPLFLCERQYLTQPLLYLSAFFEKYRDEYYQHLLAVSREGDWRGWIEYFLRGIALQAREALEGANQLLDLYAKYRGMLTGKRIPQAAVKLIDHLFDNPVISIPRLAKKWNMSFPTVSKGVDALIKAKILTETTGRSRNRMYIARELMDMMLPPGDRARQMPMQRTY